MKILHYSLGLPPYRTGGLTKYCTDLMTEQVNQDNQVFLLFPGIINNKNSEIKYYKNYLGIRTYELINPLPVPLMKGVSNPKEYMNKCDKSIFVEFLKKIEVKIVHIHTLMGLYKEFLEACKEVGVKIIYTSHDYFGICLKVNFLDYENNVCCNRNSLKCAVCNLNAGGLRKIKILQSRSYRWLKNKGIISLVKNIIIKMKKNRRSKMNINEEIKKDDLDEYNNLIKYYEQMFGYINKILFNSEVTKEIYKKHLNVEGIVIPITHKDIEDNREKKIYGRKGLNLLYLGPNEKYKGYDLILEVMDSLMKDGKNDIKLDTYGAINLLNKKMGQNIQNNGPYKYIELKNIFNKTDVLIVPSIWYETFGFITLEGLSYGVPVIVTDRVGSKDLLDGGDKGLIIGANKLELLDAINTIYMDKKILLEWNENILNKKFDLTINKHCERILSVYKE